MDFQAMRLRRQRQRRIVIVASILLITVLLVAAVVYNTGRPAATESALTIKVVTPLPRPQSDGVSAGNPNAPVNLDVWEDFQCPGCKFYSDTIEPLLMNEFVETGTVYYTFHFFPFIDDSTTTKESDQAASASLCAAEQGRFWDYHDMLFANQSGENQGAFADHRLAAFAEALGLNTSDFENCYDEKRYRANINQDLAVGKQRGVSSTPSIFVNGQLVTASAGPGYIPSYEDIALVIQTILGGTPR